MPEMPHFPKDPAELAATLATLLVLPYVYALLQARHPKRVSLDPDDPLGRFRPETS